MESIIQELKGSCDVEGWEVSFRIVANDASPGILEALAGSGAPFTIYQDPHPDDYYLNRVYRAWNYAAESSLCENICFVNSDMIFSPNWLKSLLKHHNEVNIPTSRLIESGKMPSGQYGLSFNCGQTLKEFNDPLFREVCGAIKDDGVAEGGLFMPCVFEKSRFLEAGGFPEGNIYQDGVGTRGVFVESGDSWFFRELAVKWGMRHITVFDSLVYHFQEGEKDE